jgi:predicted nucleic acid-binding protein
MHAEPIYVDSSAFYALMDRSDMYHLSAKSLWPHLLDDGIGLQTSNYVVSETISLIQHRLGYDAASIWYKDVLGVLDVIWVDQDTHRRAYELWMNLGRQQHSLVDCISYVIMYQNQIEKAFCFKRSYARQGFTLIAPLDHTPSHPSKGDSHSINSATRS